MAHETPIPLDTEVAIIGDRTAELLKAIHDDGINLPRDNARPRLGLSSLLGIANEPVGLALSAYQRGYGNYLGRLQYAIDREQAIAVRTQFADFLQAI
ncbi:MAG: hypothetical protein AAB909_01315 [Patescibacteria group bacterium]